MINTFQQIGTSSKRLGGNHKVAAVSFNLGCTKGLGSSTRVFNYCKQHTNNDNNYCLSQFINTK